MGKSSDPPPAPDYEALAKLDATNSQRLIDLQTQQNRPNQITPWGSSTWTNTPTLDTPAYQKAVQDWDAQNQQGTWVPPTEPTYGINPNDPQGGVVQLTPGTPGRWEGATSSNTPRPSESQFMTSGWSQKLSLDPAEQANLDSQRNIQTKFNETATGLLGNVQGSLSNPLTTEGLPAMTGYNTQGLPNPEPNNLSYNYNQGANTDWSGLFDLDPGFGAVQEVRDAMMSRMEPARARLREQELQRLRNQGLGDNTEAFQRAVKRLDEGDTDAEQQALLGAAGEYGNIFTRGLNANTQEMARQFGQAELDNTNANTRFNQATTVQQLAAQLRGQKFAEQGAAAQLSGTQRQQMLAEQNLLRQMPFDDLMRLRGQPVQSPQMPSFAMAGLPQNANLAGAAGQTYNANLANYNAQQQSGDNILGGLMGLAGSVLGGPIGGVAGKALGGWLGQ